MYLLGWSGCNNTLVPSLIIGSGAFNLLVISAIRSVSCRSELSQARIPTQDEEDKEDEEIVFFYDEDIFEGVFDDGKHIYEFFLKIVMTIWRNASEDIFEKVVDEDEDIFEKVVKYSKDIFEKDFDDTNYIFEEEVF